MDGKVGGCVRAVIMASLFLYANQRLRGLDFVPSRPLIRHYNLWVVESLHPTRVRNGSCWPMHGVA